jgi:hypothetical protein
VDILKEYKLIVEEENEHYIKLIVPNNYNPFVIEEIRFRAGKNVLIKKFHRKNFLNYCKKNYQKVKYL